MSTGLPELNALTDSPRAGDQHLGRQRWRSLDPVGLAPAERALWRTLAGGAAAWSAALEGIPPGLRLYVVDHAPTSQFEELRRLGRELEPLTPLASLAAFGEEFRGQRDRRWVACRGNLHLCAVFSPGRTLRRLGPGLSVLPAVAVVDCIDEIGEGALRPGIKWVNDILLNGEKVAGVISSSQVQGERVECAQLGIGINVARAPAVVRDVFVPAAGCLGDRLAGDLLPLSRVTLALLRALMTRYRALIDDGPDELFARYCERSLVLNRAVRIWTEEHPPPAPPTHRGVVEAIEPDLTLRIRGCREPVRRGRLALEEACQEAGL